jgi:hypothetical protein
MDPLRPIAPSDRIVPAVELVRLSPVEREREKERRERERRRREQAAKKSPERRDEPHSGIDVRV